MTSCVADPTSEDSLGTPVKDDSERATVDTSHQLQSPDSVQHTAPAGRKKADLHIAPLETSKGPETGTHGPKLDKEGSSSFIKREKVSQDGYNWRKYGQKNVKGNEFIRSYYKCTQVNCNVKKQVERSLEGLVIDTVYFGRHDHPKPQSSIPFAVGFQVSIMEERSDSPSSVCAEEKSLDVPKQEPQQLKPTDAPRPIAITPNEDAKSVCAQKSRLRDGADDDDPALKRKKNDGHNADSASVDKLRGDSRLVVQTSGDSETVNDGYRWRKYGQKLVKGNPNPRSYYRCSSPGCPAKKHVERASYDPKVVLTTYEAQHDHEMPPSRTVTHNTVRLSSHTAIQTDDTRTKPEGNTACIDELVKDNSGLGTNSKEQLDSNLENRTSICNAATSSVPDHQKKLTDQDNTKAHCKSEEGDSAHGETVVSQDDSVPQKELAKDVPSCQSSAKRDETSNIRLDTVGKNSEKHQQVRGATAVPS